MRTYQPMTKPGEWRARVRWVWTSPRFWYRVDQFPEGTVYLGRCGWLFFTLMVKG